MIFFKAKTFAPKVSLLFYRIICSIQSKYDDTLVKTSGTPFAQRILTKDPMPICTPLLTSGPPESPCEFNFQQFTKFWWIKHFGILWNKNIVSYRAHSLSKFAQRTDLPVWNLNHMSPSWLTVLSTDHFQINFLQVIEIYTI